MLPCSTRRQHRPQCSTKARFDGGRGDDQTWWGAGGEGADGRKLEAAASQLEASLMSEGRDEELPSESAVTVALALAGAPAGGGPARVAQTGAGGRGGSAGQTNRHGESADQEILIRRDVGDEPAVVSNGGV